MSGLTQLVEQSLDGQKLANFWIDDVRRGVSTQDALFDRVRLIVGMGDAERLRAFCRTISKALERAA
jgi:hypothetical protein